MPVDVEFEIYKGKKFSSLMKDIVLNSQEKKDTIDKLVDDLKPLVKNTNDALMLVPMIKEYLDIGVRNDEQLVKLAAVVQRLLSSGDQTNGETGSILSQEEREQLLKDAESITKEVSTPIEVNPPKTG